jgi:hypothetical protein
MHARRPGGRHVRIGRGLDELLDRRRVGVLAAALLASACTATLPIPIARPSPSGVLAPRSISAHSPIASCGGADQLVDAPEEPSLAVDPADPTHLVAAWQQDRRPAGAAYGAAVAVSRDGGASWNEAMLPSLARCTGGPYPLVSDTWASIGPDHTAYVSALALTTGRPQGSSVVVSASRDGGRSWAAPVVVASGSPPQALLDKPSILADPRRPGRVYAVWARFEGSAGDQVGFARSDDHGATWSAPAAITAGGAVETQNNELLAPAAGVLLDVFAQGSPLQTNHEGQVGVLRSTDGGLTWAPPVTVASFAITQTTDPDSGTTIRAFGQDVVAAAGAGWTYAAWFENRRDGTSAIWTSGSADGGRTWSAPSPVVQESAQPFLPTLAVAGDGRLGATWYDLRDAAAGPGLGTALWAGASGDHGRAWRSSRLDRPFDLRAAPVATGTGPFIGDYEGLAGLSSGFAAAWVRTTAGGTPNRTEIAFARFR